ncbi:uncharacterized protein LOC121684876 [Alosa sapidissima]|uniref:uncharacterized protein LOC121684876 n=1 Tax=Alosa sapidissima TaxID=34773 RepID=UPI001C08201B|nr:uncharacterized protein LOC121684876 [Alosa sapidissima]
MKASKLKQLGIIDSQNVITLAAELCCNADNKVCMYRECMTCKNKSLTSLKNPSETGITWWYQWVTKKEEYEKEIEGEKEKIAVTKTVKQICEGNAQHLFEDLEKDLNGRVCKHLFNIKHQYAQLQSLHRTLRDDEVILHVDYAENWQCKYAKEVQQVHFGASHRQATLHNVVMYTSNNTLSFCTLSPSMKHDPAAIWAQLDPVLQFLKVNYPRVDKLFFISDGPTMQYRGKKNFYLMSIIPFQMGFRTVNWSFLEAGHGKGPADGVGATIKRTADTQVARGSDIPSAKTLYETLRTLTKVHLFYVEDDQISRVSALLPKELPTIKGTLSLHQVICTTPGTIYHRVLSCFCEREGVCGCFQPKAVDLAPQTVGSIEPQIIEGTSGRGPLCPLDEITEDLKGKWCIVIYENDPYPGIIEDVDEGAVEVKVMCSAGQNKFFWPLIEDKIWYTQDNVMTLISPPEKINSRHVQGKCN